MHVAQQPQEGATQLNPLNEAVSLKVNLSWLPTAYVVNYVGHEIMTSAYK